MMKYLYIVKKIEIQKIEKCTDTRLVDHSKYYIKFERSL